MRTLYYIGLDIHKKVIAYCIKTIEGSLFGAGTIAATRKALDEWMEGLPRIGIRNLLISVRRN